MSIVGVDIGGTCTDLVAYRSNTIITSETSTVPADPTERMANNARQALGIGKKRSCKLALGASFSSPAPALFGSASS